LAAWCPCAPCSIGNSTLRFWRHSIAISSRSPLHSSVELGPFAVARAQSSAKILVPELSLKWPIVVELYSLVPAIGSGGQGGGGWSAAEAFDFPAERAATFLRLNVSPRE